MALYGAAKAPAVKKSSDGTTQAALTDSSGGTKSQVLVAGVNSDALTHAFGTADNTIADVTATFNQTILNDNFKEVSDQLATQRTLNTVLLNHVASLAGKLSDLISHMNDGRV